MDEFISCKTVVSSNFFSGEVSNRIVNVYKIIIDYFQYRYVGNKKKKIIIF